MVWLYHSPIPVGSREVIFLFKWFLPAVTGLEEGEGVGTLCVKKSLYLEVVGASGSQGASILRKFAVLLPPVNKEFLDGAGVFLNFKDYRVVNSFITGSPQFHWLYVLEWHKSLCENNSGKLRVGVLMGFFVKGSWGILYGRVFWKVYWHNPRPWPHH